MPDSDQPAALQSSWMSDVQRVLALLLIGSIAFCTVLSTVVLVLSSSPSDSLIDMSKTLQAAVVNMALIALGFFFGNTIAKMAQDTSQQKLTDKLTSTPPGTLPPVPSLAPISPWWPKLTDAEKNAITTIGPADPRVAAFIVASTTGAANTDDLAYLVSKGLLAADRPAIIQAG